MSRCRPVRGLYSTATDVLVPPTLLSGQFAAADHSAFFLVFLFPLPTHQHLPNSGKIPGFLSDPQTDPKVSGP